MQRKQNKVQYSCGKSDFLTRFESPSLRQNKNRMNKPKLENGLFMRFFLFRKMN